jgi:hypothetical protein
MAGFSMEISHRVSATKARDVATSLGTVPNEDQVHPTGSLVIKGISLSPKNAVV